MPGLFHVSEVCLSNHLFMMSCCVVQPQIGTHLYKSDGKGGKGGDTVSEDAVIAKGSGAGFGAHYQTC